MATTAPGRESDIAALREQIDTLDAEMLALVNRRASVAQAIGELKRADGSPAFRPDREAAVIDGLKARNAGPLPAESVAPIWREIMSACRALETPTRVAYLGPAGTFSELAALGYFGSSIVKVLCANADEVFHATSAGAADFGVVPVENSSEGVVTRSLDLFLTTPLIIVGETSLYVRHNLLRRVASSAGRSPAMPKARAWPASTRAWPASPASAPAASSACTWWRPRSRTTRTTGPVSPWSRIRRRIRSRRQPATTASAWSSRCRTGPARFTTCSCRSRFTASR